MSKPSYAIIGRGSLFQPIREILTGHVFHGYYDDRPTDDPTWLGGISGYKDNDNDSIFVAIAALRNMLLRRNLIRDLVERNLLRLNAVSERAYIAPSAILGMGNVICANSTLHSRAKLGNGSVIFSNVSIEHDADVGSNVNIAPGVTIAGSVKVNDDCFIGAGSVLIDGIVVGSGSVIGAGSVVLKSIPEGSLVYGNPAKVIRRNDLYLEPSTK
ncbi:MAG TPA: DapH/DapD/GlmU-related protein [Microvirga sp.]|nr:DapH/DapD/GlmU-related protein [Microvirga sp.]